MSFRNKIICIGDLVIYKYYKYGKENSPIGLVVEDRFADLGKVEVLWYDTKLVEWLDDIEVVSRV